MGAINYGRNEFFNLGLNINEIEVEEFFIYDDCEEIINELGRLDYYEVKLKSGYYDGFYLDIDNSFSCYSGYEKQEAQKELTILKECLLRLIDIGLVYYSQGWCTGYSDKEETKLKLKEAVKKERERIRKIRVR